MLPGAFTPGDVTAFTSRVTVNGVNRPAVSVSFSGDWRSDLPSQISPGGSNIIRSGTVEWATERDTLDRPVTAFQDWGVWRPAKGDRIVVYAGDGESEWERFTGVVDETTGAVGSGMSSTFLVDVDPLSEEFEAPALLGRMYPRSGSTTWRNAGLSPMYLVDAAMRAGNYYVTPPTLSYACLSAPLQGSMLPAVGTSAELVSGDGHTGSGVFQQNWGAPWGLASSNFVATYAPAFQRTPSSPVAIQMMFSDAHAGGAYVTVRYGASNYLRLIVNGSGHAVLQRLRGSTLVEVCRIANVVGPATRVEVLIKNSIATMRSNDGRQATGAVSELLSQPMSRIEVSAEPDARIAGVQVSHPEAWQEFQYLNFENTARIRTHAGNTTTWGIINASPRYENTHALAVLEDLADQTLSALWIDELGVLNFGPSAGVRGLPSMQTITTADDVLALSWSDRVLAVAKRVTVHYKHPAFKSGTLRSIDVARGSRQTLRRGDVHEDVYRPSGDVDWYGVDANPRKLPNFGWEEYNNGVGSYTGVTYYIDDDPAYGTLPSSTTITTQQTGLAEYTVTHEAGNYPAGVTAETTTYPEYDGSGLWERNRSTPLPVLRAWGLAEWIERRTTQQTNQPGPVLNVQLEAMALVDTAQRVRDYLVDHVQNAFPQITGLQVTPDPRRQIADIITIRSENFLGVTLRCIITGIDETINEAYEQSLTLEVLDVTVGALTWEQWEQAYPGTLTYTQWRSLQGATDTYDDFNTDPLKGA